MNENQSQPHVKAKKQLEVSLSPIWFLPVIALLISVWLLVKVNLESKVPITIEMSSAQGVVAGKSLIKFRGINAGRVTKIEVAESLSHVIVHAEIEPDLSDFLTTETRFWVVRAQISLAGVSGLDTVLSGDYIAFLPGKMGEPKRHFRALNSAPPIGDDDPGLRITLTSETLGSISEGSQLFYRQIPIGEVRFYELSEDARTVHISALIEPQYSHLVNQSTVFWNSGGMRLKGSLSGFEVKTESLSAILAGGISLFTPNTDGPDIKPSHTFTLYEDYDDAGVGVPISIAFASGYDLQPGITKVKFHGIDVGHLDTVDVMPDDDSGVSATVIIDPGAESLLVEDSQFWLVKPNLSIRNLSNLETLISGNYITLKVGNSEEMSRDYEALDGPPPPDFKDPGLHIILQAANMGSISTDTPILFKGVEVGRVANVFIDNLSQGVGFHLHIRPEYDHLINTSSRFWDASGLEVSAGLSGIHVRSESLMNILRGGIAFETTNAEAGAIEDGHKFQLLDNPLTSENPLKIELEVVSADNLTPNVTTVKYRGMGMGVLRRLEYNQTTDKIIAHFDLNNQFDRLIREHTQFWLVEPRIEAASIKGLDSLVGGPYLTFKPGAGKSASRFVLQDMPASKTASDPGLILELIADKSMTIVPGAPVSHRQVVVGSVQQVRLQDNQVLFKVHIEPKYQYLVKPSSRFWNTSGVRVNAGLDGVDVSTDSLSALLAGGIAFGMEGDVNIARVIGHGEQFKLYESESLAASEGIEIAIHDPLASGVKVGSAIRYRSVPVGEVIQQSINQDGSIELRARVFSNYQYLLTDQSKLWLAKAQLGLTNQKNLPQLLSGPEIRVVAGKGQATDRFQLHYQQPITKTLQRGLNLILETNRLGSVTVGAPVYYRQVVVGEVLGHGLSSDADKVLIYVNIQPDYAVLIRENTRFWNVSGIKMSAGLFSGVEVQAESVESLLAGGIAFATPTVAGERVSNGALFVLAKLPEEDWLEWTPIIPL